MRRFAASVLGLSLCAAGACSSYASDELPEAGDAGPQDAAALDATSTPEAEDAGGCDPTAPFTRVEEVLELNGQGLGNSGARLTADGLRVFVYRVLTDDFRIFSAFRPSTSALFETPTEVGLGRPDGELDAYPFPTADGAFLYFVRSTGGALGGRDILVAEATSGGFKTPSLVEGLSLPDIKERAPFLGSDGALWFDFEPAEGGVAKRIARALPLGGGKFGSISTVDLGAPTDADDGDPVLSADGLTLYFSSKRGAADRNVWIARRASLAAPFNPPEALSVLNTIANEEPSWISPDECELYFHGYRPSGYRIFRARR